MLEEEHVLSNLGDAAEEHQANWRRNGRSFLERIAEMGPALLLGEWSMHLCRDDDPAEMRRLEK
jgi:hypothetical protein